MIKLLRATIKKDPAGTFTVTVEARNEIGQVIVGHSGGVPKEYVRESTSRIHTLLDTAQAHVATLFNDAAVPY